MVVLNVRRSWELKWIWKWLYCHSFYEEIVTRMWKDGFQLHMVVLSKFFSLGSFHRTPKYMPKNHFKNMAKYNSKWSIKITPKLYGWRTHWRWWWTFRRQCWSHLSAQSLSEPKKTPISNPNAYKFSKTKIIHPNSPHKFKSLS